MSARTAPSSDEWGALVAPLIAAGERYARLFGFRLDELDTVSPAICDGTWLLVACAVDLYQARHGHMPSALEDALFEMQELDPHLTAQLRLAVLVAWLAFPAPDAPAQPKRSNGRSPRNPPAHNNTKEDSHD